ncbi:hypothetical protein Gpo141_00006765 [Globisporangium polare]
MSPHRRDSNNNNQSDEAEPVSVAKAVTTTTTTTARTLYRKALSGTSLYSSGPVCIDVDPVAQENGVERTVDVKKDEESSATTSPASERRRKRDVVRQISMRLYLKGKDIAEDVLRNVALQRMEDAENVCNGKDSSLEHEIPASRKTRKHLWLPMTQDDSVLLQGSSKESFGKGPHHDINDFFVSRVTDPTSYFFRFRYDDHRHLTPQKAEVQLVDIKWLKSHEEIVSWERVSGLKKATISWDAYTEPLLVDIKTGAILDGHHRYNVGVQLRLKQLPAVLVDYLGDDTITVDVWPGCGRSKLTKEEVIAMSLSPNVFPPKTSRHRFTESLPPISIPLSILRQSPTPIVDLITTASLSSAAVAGKSASVSSGASPPAAASSSAAASATSEGGAESPRDSRLRQVSIDLICGAQNLATSVTKSLFRSRLRKIDRNNEETQLDMIKRPTFDTTNFFNAVRENDPSSSFCQQRSATFEDLLSSDASTRQKFFLTRICDPTSYFYKYHFDSPPKRSPRKVTVKLASLKWLKAHEHVVSWDRVDGLRHATKTWDAYLEPLLVDAVTGSILDGHHRFHVGLQLGLQCVPVVLVNYLEDETITVDVWPNCGRDSLTKQEVIEMSLSDSLFPPKTSRHTFSDDLPPISVPLERLRVALEGNYGDL